MDKNDQIYIKPKRGRLPRKYEYIGPPHPWTTGVRWILLYLCILSLMAYTFYRIRQS